MASKVLVVGPIEGDLTKAFQKIAKLHAKQDFAFALITGDLFSQEGPINEVQALLSGSLTVPLPTYFTLGHLALPEPIQRKLEDDDEICSNLIYLGRKGTLNTTEKIKIVYLGGKQVENEGSLTQSIGKYDALYLENEARALRGNNSAHILLTNSWPDKIDKGSSIALPADIDTEHFNTTVSNLCALLKPRYHFCPAKAQPWKREPFIWPMDYSENGEAQVTRFESLANSLGKTSDWLSAFTLDPTKPALTEGAQRGAPFTTTTVKRKRDAMEVDAHPRNRESYGRGRGGKRPRNINFDPNDCFMCLGKPTFSADMVISIGEEAFVTSLRGPLAKNETFTQLKSTGNLMIIPMYHAADETSHGRRARSELESEYKEMTRYRHAMQQMLLSKAKGELGAVCWEVNRTGIRHFHWQWIACPQDLISKGLVDAAFKLAAEKNSHERFKTCNADSLLDKRHSDYFRVWIWSATMPLSVDRKHENGKTDSASNTNLSPITKADELAAGAETQSHSPAGTVETSMYFELSPDQRFNIQFGRSVMSSLLKLEHRVDWKSVAAMAEEGEEGRDAEMWKEDFGEFDFAMA